MLNFELVGQRLQSEREVKGYSRAEMGNVTEVSSRTIISYEKGERIFPADFVIKLEQNGFDIQYILFDRRFPKEITNDDMELVEGMNRLSEDNANAIKLLIKALGKNKK